MITTIIPTYRRPQSLKRAIQSVLDQSYPHFRVYIYDNGGDEETKKILEGFYGNSRIQYHIHPENIGSNANFQYGLERVETPYFSFLSDDDYLLPHFYETVLEGFHRFPEIGFCAGGNIYVNEKREMVGRSPHFQEKERYFQPPEGSLELLDGAIPIWTSILFKKEMIQDIGPLDVNSLIDIDFLTRITLKYPYLIKSKPCAVFLRHSESISSNEGLNIFYPSIYDLLKKQKNNPDMPEKFSQIFETTLLQKLKTLIFKFGLFNLEKGNPLIGFQASKVLREVFHDKKLSLFLSLVYKCSQILPIRALLRIAGKGYRRLREKNRHRCLGTL
jgi:glycosyltransferase involved in cell wall biosynthesis